MHSHTFTNNTWNQHFVSQAEQKFNSQNPESKKSAIYYFEILDKSTRPPTIKSEGKKRVESTFAERDLFTIQKLSGKDRVNLERLFHRYESEYADHNRNLLRLVRCARRGKDNNVISINWAGITNELQFIYKNKIMGWIRNPYKIKEILRIFGPASNMVIASPDALDLYQSITNIEELEIAYVCSKFDITFEEYKTWIKIIILFLYFEKENENTILDGYAEQFFSANELRTFGQIHYFDGAAPLLPDVGVAIDRHDGKHIFYINMSKNCFMVIQHVELEGKYSQDLLTAMNIDTKDFAALLPNLRKNKSIKLYSNNLEMLAGYNQICVKSSRLAVLCASSIVHGINVIS